MEEIKAMVAKGDYVPTRKDAPEYEVDASFWENARIVMPQTEPKKSVRLQIEPEVFHWFKSQGAGHITRMQAVIKSYYEAHTVS
ncbi:MAG: BrnA antitoxin family protein [Bacteroidota bacterium]